MLYTSHLYLSSPMPCLFIHRALTITMYHWGFAAWSPYLMMAISGGLGAYCFGLPLTVRSSFYPILGKYTWGWIGDFIDGWSIVMTVAGVCIYFLYADLFLDRAVQTILLTSYALSLLQYYRSVLR